MDLIPGLGRSPGGGNNNPPQYSCVGNPMDRGAWQATNPEGRKEQVTTEATQQAHMQPALKGTVLSRLRTKPLYNMPTSFAYEVAELC